MASELTVNGVKYRVERLNPLDAYDVARKYSPVLMVLGNLVKGDPAKPPPGPMAFARAIVAVSSQIRDDDAHSALGLCLSVVSREVPGGAAYSPIREPRTGAIMFQDIDMRAMLQLAWAVLEYNELPSFFSEPLSSSTEEAAQQG